MPDTKPLTIFLIEDDEVDALSVKRAFTSTKIDCSMHSARDGMEALEMLRSGSVPEPRIILLDLNMPRMNGIEFLRELRNDPALRSQVVFVLTTSQSDEDKVAAYDCNVAGYMIKNEFTGEFEKVISMLDRFWKTVDLPASQRPGASKGSAPR